VYESGTIETKPNVLPLSIGDGELCETALTTVSVPEMFQYWLQGERITIGFLGGAQVDRFGNLNSTVIGDYAKPKVRLPGSGGATEIATGCQRIYIVMRHNAARVRREAELPHVARSWADRPRAPGARPPHRGACLLVTDLCIMRPDPGYEGVPGGEPSPRRDARAGREATGWPVAFADRSRRHRRRPRLEAGSAARPECPHGKGAWNVSPASSANGA
jgi:glutaconate CoA-transferase, subunit B